MTIAVVILAVIAVGSLALAAHLHGELRDAEVKHRGEIRRLKYAYRRCRDQLGRKVTHLERELRWATNSRKETQS